jgi:RHS repeat-associated protein
VSGGVEPAEGRGSDERGAERGESAPPARGEAGATPGAPAGGTPLPTISLPKGGGALRGIGDKLSVNPSMGTVSLSVPLEVSPGRSTVTPELSLSYDSGAGNGPFGLGWGLGLPSVLRRTDRGLPRYDDGDTFVLSSAEDLVPALRPDGTRDRLVRPAHAPGHVIDRYRPRIEGPFARIERWTDADGGDVHWRSTTQANVTNVYGRTPASRIADPARPERVFQWLLSDQYDDRGNATHFAYQEEDGAGVDRRDPGEANRGALAQRYLKAIRYANRAPVEVGAPLAPRDDWLFEVVFDYGDEDGQPWPVRADPFSTHRPGFEVRTYRLCRRVLLFHRLLDDPLVRSYDLDHDENPTATLLTGLTRAGYRGNVRRTLPPVELDYTRAVVDDRLRPVVDEDGDPVEHPVDGIEWRWADLESVGAGGALMRRSAGWFFRPNLGGGRLGALAPVASWPSTDLDVSTAQLADLTGDGRADLVDVQRPLAGWSRRTADGTWGRFEPFAAQPVLPSIGSPQLADLTGDGRPDVVALDEDGVTWLRSLGPEGFEAAQRLHHAGDEAQAPRVLLDQLGTAVRLADMSGDGLADLVRIRATEVCYWPNRGYGRFGPRVAMGGTFQLDEPGRFDPRRVHLGDVDGSGTTDLVYAGARRVTLWPNQSGNRIGPPVHLDGIPPPSRPEDVAVLDLLGTGTAALVLSSSDGLAYADLLREGKPHLLTRVRNQIGLETRITYTTSTVACLADREAGVPWRTTVPFPVHVASRIEHEDLVVGSRTAKEYVYRDGWYDGVEREFRGFGFVEERDGEVVPLAGAPGVEDAAGRTYRAPPSVTRTWFHVGLDPELVEEPVPAGHTAVAGPSVVPSGLDGRERRQAWRALKGQLLHQEVFGDDGTDLAELPYFVVDRSWQVDRLQPHGEGEHEAAVFFARPRETLQVRYERDLADPHVAHDLVLRVDDFGNPEVTASVAYGRTGGGADPLLRPDDRARQERTMAMVTEAEHTEPVLAGTTYRAPVRSRTRTYEVFGLPTPALALSFDEVADHLGAAADLPVDDVFGEAGAGRRLVQEERNLYYDAGLTGPLPLGQMSRRALLYQSFTLAFAKGQVATLYPDLLAQPRKALLAAGYAAGTDLHERGWFPDEAAKGTWWVPSAVTLHGRPTVPAVPEALAPPIQDAADAAAHFFVPRATRDAFGHHLVVDYDAHDLVVRRSRDPLGNVVEAEIDHRTLSAASVTDPNGNRVDAAYDALGQLVATASMGKVGEDLGDTLAGLVVDPDQQQLDDFFADPDGPAGEALLAGASSRHVYDPHRFHRTEHLDRPLPLYAATLGRERHHHEGAGPGRLRVSLTYADGLSREIQRKAQAEPDAGGARWLATGWVVLDDKGNPVRSYEHFFSRSHEFEAGNLHGLATTRLYDPLRRTIAGLHPDHSYEKVRFGPWRIERWDRNDTSTRTAMADPDASALAHLLPVDEVLPSWAQRLHDSADPVDGQIADDTAVHADTPIVTYLDALGRVFLTVIQNRRVAGGPVEPIATRLRHDGEGAVRSVEDALGRTAVRFEYDLAGTRVAQHSIDGGSRWALNDVRGNPVQAWDSSGVALRYEYDALRRRTAAFVGDRLVERTDYGEGAPQPEQRNLRGRVHVVADGAGTLENAGYDFKGNPVSATRRFVTGHPVVDWANPPALGAEAWTTATTFDALNRPTRIATPDGSETHLTYNDAGLIEAVAVGLRGADPVPVVAATEYDELGKRTKVDFGNGAVATFAHDPANHWLAASRLATADDRVVQDLRYTYDAVGNPCRVDDRGDPSGTIFFRNRRVEPGCRYTYDAAYRLVEATGREHLGLDAGAATAPGWDGVGHVGLACPTDGLAMARYRERYEYDAVGNLLAVDHTVSDATASGWRRRNTFEAGSNRLATSTVQGRVERFEHDDRGVMTSMPHLTSMTWDHASRLVRVDRGGGGRVWNQYDSLGNRVRTIWEKAPGHTEERIYVGPFERVRVLRADGTPSLVRETLHVMDEEGKVASFETRTLGQDDGPEALLRYQHTDLVKSIQVELDGEGRVISYEQYSPYGATSHQSTTALGATPKRYRFTGAERDEATGLSVHGIRHYAPWLGRWTSCDPTGIEDGTNLYAYAHGAPTRLVDPSGKGGEDPDPILNAIWKYGTKVPDRASLGRNIQGDHPIQVALRKLETLGEYTRDVSKVNEEYVVLVETGKGLFHTELGKLQYEIGIRKIAGDIYTALKRMADAKGLKLPPPDPRMILSESELITETLKAYEQAAKATNTTLREGEAVKAILSHLGTLGTTGASGAGVAKKVENAKDLTEIIIMIARGSARWAKAIELLRPALTAAKPILGKLGPIGIACGIFFMASEAHAATGAATKGDVGSAAIHGIDATKEALYLIGLRVPPALIPAIAISITELADEHIGFTDQAAKDAVAGVEWMKTNTGLPPNLLDILGGVASVGLSWQYALTPQGWVRMAVSKIWKK